MRIDAAGLLDTAEFVASPNCDERPPGTEINLLVIHNISLPPDEFGGNGVIELFTNRIDPAAHPYYQALQGLKVSVHFFIRRDGALIQFVPCSQRAWHAGVSCWQGKERCNDFSIGIELEGSDTTPFTDAQYTELIALTQCLCQRYPIQNIAGHSDIAPGRKTDPGPWFDWQRYTGSLDDNLDKR
ncbi:MAG: 1,6-anhydro-N-acetylmuramyl-L-alanine amidase AmpD [Nitrosomonas sp.]|uniref:1,6-anhydro-N-acetylmuramyl-L-alanine amidase AmpD n=1 Tax=Nitrosomonas sp. TaxID=42353 RepID=UPI0032EB6F6B